MAEKFSKEMADALDSTPPVLVIPGAAGGRLRRHRATIDLAAQATIDTITIAQVPKDQAFAFGLLTADTSLGTSTIAVGIAGTTGKYRAALVHTTPLNIPVLFGPLAAVEGLTAAQEKIFITIAAAALPGAGKLMIDLYFSGA